VGVNRALMVSANDLSLRNVRVPLTTSTQPVASWLVMVGRAEPLNCTNPYVPTAVCVGSVGPSQAASGRTKASRRNQNLRM
jgi:hypothetical protein